jgi:oxalate---CoA ligase
MTSRSRWSIFEVNTEEDAKRPAIYLPGFQNFSFSQLLDMFLDLARVLSTAGLQRETVAVIQADGACALISLLGAVRVGPACPIDPSLTASELRQDLIQLGAGAVIVDDEASVAAVMAARIGMAVIEAKTSSSRCHWRLVRETAISYERPLDTELLFLLHTSATTGRRKLVPLTAQNVSAMIENTLRVTRLTKDDRLLLLARSFHIQGALSVLAQLRVGGSVIAPDVLAPMAVHKLLLEFGPTWYTCGPTMHRALLSEIKQSGSVPNSLRFVRSAGAPLPTALEEALSASLQVPVLNVYGLSETGGVASTTLDEPSPVGSVGRSMGPEIAVMDRSGAILQPAEEGEIVVRGPVVMQGYYSDEVANREAFHDGWFRTGDLGQLDSSGHLFIRGRLKEIINRGGEKVLPDEIDAVLAKHSAVRDVAAFALPHATLGEDIGCAVVLWPGKSASPEELTNFAAEKLAYFKVPHHIFVRETIPRGSTGKPKRLLLREEYAQASERFVHRVTLAETPSIADDKSKIVRIWASFLDSDNIGDHDDFFAHGGDSLSATSMLAAVAELFGLPRPLSAEAFISNPTVTGVMRALADAEEVETAGENRGIAYPMRKGGGLGTLFFVPVSETKGLYLRRMMRHLGGDWASYLLRPSELAPFRPLYSIEDAARHVVIALKHVQPKGPYVIGGYCQGGLIAFEAGLVLERGGESVSLILFDTPFPGGASAVRQWQMYSTNARDKVRAATRGGTLKPMLQSVRSMSRRATWLALRRLRPILARLWRVPPVRSVCAWATQENFDFYRAGKGRMPILHIVAKDETSRMLGAARLRWGENTTGKVSYLWVAGDHSGLFHEVNFGTMCEVIETWLGKQSSTALDQIAGAD